MIKVITYGTYDLLHQGHLNLLKRAKALGDWLIVGVTNDNFDRERGKLNVRNNVLERVEAVKATGLADQIVIEDYVVAKWFTCPAQRGFPPRCCVRTYKTTYVSVSSAADV